MIRRTLVPVDVKPMSGEERQKPAARLTTAMDDRMVVPAGRSNAPPLDGKSSIPEHLPLGVLASRLLVPRGMPAKPFERTQATQEAGAVALDVLASRKVIPARVRPLAPEEIAQPGKPVAVTPELRQVVELDIFLTGDANLLMEPEEKRNVKWDSIARIASLLAHFALILFLINIPNIFKPHVPTQDEIALAQKELSFVYTPPENPTPRPPAPKLPRIDPKMLERMQPPVERPVVPEPTPTPQPVKPAPDLPDAPTSRVSPAPPQPAPAQQPPQALPPSQLEPIKPHPNPHLNLGIPDSTPGQTLHDQLQDAIKRQGGPAISTQGRLPGGSGQGPSANAQVQTLSPTQGVNFDSYITRMLARIKANWYAVMPQSAQMGDQGMVYLTFTINSDGSIQPEDPELQRTSDKEPLDNAAMSSIRTSNPFEPLPRDFHGPNMKFGIVFLYNLPLDYLNSH